MLLAVPSAWPQSNYATPYFFTTLAGESSIGSADGIGSAARFYHPTGVAIDPVGNLYVTDSRNCTIRKITPAGLVSTFVGQPGMLGSVDGVGSNARFHYVAGITIGQDGNFYVADYNTIRKITPAGVVTTLAGVAGITGSDGSEDGIGGSARFNKPNGIAVDAAGTLFVADYDNSTVRKITSSGVVSTIAGQAGTVGTTDGSGGDARFDHPNGIAVDPAGNLYVVDSRNCTIRKITPDGNVSTLAGAAGYGFGQNVDGTGSSARFGGPFGVAIDAVGNLYVTDSAIRKITPAGVVTTIAKRVSADGTDNLESFQGPSGIAVDRSGILFVADYWNNTICQITAAGVVSTVAGLAPDQSSGSADGLGRAARFGPELRVAMGPFGEIYVADTHNHTVRKITSAGIVTTVAGAAGLAGSSDGTGSTARFSRPAGIAVDPVGNVYVGDSGNYTIRNITPAGAVTTLAGTAGVQGSADGTGSSAQFRQVGDLALNPDGTLYLSDLGNDNVRKVTAAGVVTTLVGPFYYSEGGRHLAFNRQGELYLAGYYDIVKVSPITGDYMSSLAGTWDDHGYYENLGFTPWPHDSRSGDGTGSGAHFDEPLGLVFDAAGNTFVADTGNNTIRKITPDGLVTTLAGKPGYFGQGHSDGIGSEARFMAPTSVALDATGIVYVADGSTIRKGQLAGPPVIATQPQSQTVAPGANVQFYVTAGAVPAPTYQWFFNGSGFSGATSNTLSFTNARSADAGDYTVVVTNSLGSITSNKATLTVSAAPVTPPSTPAPSSGGGGSIEGWFALAMILLGGARGISRVKRA